MKRSLDEIYSTALVRFCWGRVAKLNLRSVWKVVLYYYWLGLRVLYLPPMFLAPDDSEHGYDCLDPNTFDPRFGSEKKFRRFSWMIHKLGMSLILDIVPNHLKHWQNSSNKLWEECNCDPDLLEARFDVKIDRATGAMIFGRRFFDIWHLRGVRQENDETFRLFHKKILHWLREGVIDGLRLDHPDGLFDPKGYVQKLRAEMDLARPGEELPMLLEKILSTNEVIPKDWNVGRYGGEVGYPFFRTRQLFTNPSVESFWTAAYAWFCGQRSKAEINGLRNESRKNYQPYDEVARKAMCQVIEHTMVSGLTDDWLVEISDDAPEVLVLLDLAPAGLTKQAIKRSICSLPHVYRTYVRPEFGEVPQACRLVIEQAEDLDPIIKRMLLEPSAETAASLGISFKQLTDFVGRFQQCTAPVVAIGIENIAGFRYRRLLALCDVSMDPSVFSITTRDFLEFLLRRQADMPYSGLCIDTQDSKMNYAIALMLLALTFFAEEWVELCKGWFEANAHLWPLGQRYGALAWQIFQMMAGTWSFDEQEKFTLKMREEWLLKSIRELRDLPNATARESHWYPFENERWEEAALDYLRGLHDPTESDFLKTFIPFIKKVDGVARQLGLSQLLILLTAPGRPILYQDDEWWTKNHVDPNNRRARPWKKRLLALIHLRVFGETKSTKRLHVIRRTLEIRNANALSFGGDGDIIPDYTWGEDAIAYWRGKEKHFYIWAARRPGVRKPIAPTGYVDVFKLHEAIGFFVKNEKVPKLSIADQLRWLSKTACHLIRYQTNL